MKYHDIKRKGTVYKIKIKDRTHTKTGLPTTSNMERRLIKSLKNA